MDCIFFHTEGLKKINQRRCLPRERTSLQVRAKETQHNGFHRRSRESLAENECMKTGDKTRNLDKHNKSCVFGKKTLRVDLKRKQDCRHLKKNVTTHGCPANKQQNRTPLCL